MTLPENRTESGSLAGNSRRTACVFPVPVGRDSLLSTLDSQSLAGMRYLKRHDRKIPDINADSSELFKWLKEGTVPDDQTYAYYLMVMTRVSNVLALESPQALVEVEMLLFYLSKKRIVQARLSTLSELLPDESEG